MITINTKVKVGLAAGGLCVAMIVGWVLIDPLSHLVLLLDVAKEVNVDFNTKIPVGATIEKNIDIQMPQNLKANVLVNQKLAIPVDDGAFLERWSRLVAPVHPFRESRIR
jgi:hypothetical protein